VAAQQLGEPAVDLVAWEAAALEAGVLPGEQALVEGDAGVDQAGVLGRVVDRLEQGVLGVGIAAERLRTRARPSRWAALSAVPPVRSTRSPASCASSSSSERLARWAARLRARR